MEIQHEKKETPEQEPARGDMGGSDGGGGGKGPENPDLSKESFPDGDFREEGLREQREGGDEGGDKTVDLSKESFSDQSEIRAEAQQELRADSPVFNDGDKPAKEADQDGVDSKRVAEMKEASDNPANDLKEE